MPSSEPSEPPQHLSCCVSKISVLLRTGLKVQDERLS